MSLAAFYANSRERYKEAATLYAKAIALAPDNPLPRAYLCRTYIFMGQYADAVQSCSESIALKPQITGYINLGVAYFDRHEFTNAAAAFERAVALNPYYYIAVGHLARAYSWIPEDRNRARDTYLSAISLTKPAPERGS